MIDPNLLPDRSTQDGHMWGFLNIGLAIVSMIVPAFKHDLRWLLWIAGAAFAVAVYLLAKRTREPWLVTFFGIALTTCAMVGLYIWLKPELPIAIVTSKPSPPQIPVLTSPSPTPKIKAEETPVVPKRPRGSSIVTQSGQGNQQVTIGPGAQVNPTDCSAVGISNTINCSKPDPNRASTRYRCDGWAMTTGPGENAFMSAISDPALTVEFTKMMNLGTTSNWPELASSCKVQIANHPAWLTPYLICADAYLRLGDAKKASEYLKHFQEKKGDAYKEAPCPAIESDVVTSLQITK